MSMVRINWNNMSGYLCNSYSLSHLAEPKHEIFFFFVFDSYIPL